ncbi:hypothetical protein KSP39_PZI008724 [Platanthera zijinensis]|uniref:Reverse transcriptase/retrotransposon-derived protein RNase H-like domain-containing protein n=1 Tax=Platanthera zijinensis TaxID=2320716 RepID=A0AAP0G7W8_9ASPA
MLEWPVPKSFKNLRGFLGFTGYYRRFIKGYGGMARPLTDLLKDKSFRWTEEAATAFQHLKLAVSQPPVLRLPDFHAPFTVETDAADAGIGAVLSQEGRPIAFFSKALGLRNSQLSAYEKELLAIVLAVQHWRHYLVGCPFVIRTDHQSLRFLLEQKIATPAQQKYISKLMGYDFQIQYRRGKDNVCADALSRQYEGPGPELYALISVQSDLLQAIKASWATDPHIQKVIAAKEADPSSKADYQWQHQVLKRKGGWSWDETLRPKLSCYNFTTMARWEDTRVLLPPINV